MGCLLCGTMGNIGAILLAGSPRLFFISPFLSSREHHGAQSVRRTDGRARRAQGAGFNQELLLLFSSSRRSCVTRETFGGFVWLGAALGIIAAVKSGAGACCRIFIFHGGTFLTGRRPWRWRWHGGRLSVPPGKRRCDCASRRP